MRIWLRTMYWARHQCRITRMVVIQLQQRMGASCVFLRNPWANGSSELKWSMLTQSHLPWPSSSWVQRGWDARNCPQESWDHFCTGIINAVLSKPDASWNFLCYEFYYVSVPQMMFDQSEDCSASILKWLRKLFLSILCYLTALIIWLKLRILSIKNFKCTHTWNIGHFKVTYGHQVKTLNLL